MKITYRLLIILFFFVSCEKKVTRFDLTTNVIPTEGGTISPSLGSFDEGTTVELTSTPSTGYEFKEWSGGVTGTTNPVSVTMNSNKSITGVFIKKIYPLNITIEGEGTVTEEIVTLKSNSYNHGTVVKLTPVPADGWMFVEWSGDLIGSQNPIQITVTDSVNITSVFTNDIDGDGVLNVNDKCPNTPSGVTVNSDGCQITYIPDDRFEQSLIDLGYDDVLDDYVLTNSVISIDSLVIDGKEIYSLMGIEEMSNITMLSCKNNSLSSLNVSKNTSLTWLSCNNNSLSSLDVSKNTKLTDLFCQFNYLHSLDVSKNLSLTRLICYSNSISSLDVTNNTSLTVLSCTKNNLSSLDVSKNTKLTDLQCSLNNLSSLDVSNNTDLNFLWCYYTQLSSLDVSKNTILTNLICDWNNITSLDVSKNTSLIGLNCQHNPLSCIKVNQTQLDNISPGWSKDPEDSYSLDCSGI
ncbi:MAG: hypothetical protein PF484_14180 [Bacteroidales bacterium]|jgi:hypothetical protein|nr:hypothetical protein [Bacteroidales bacterium]